MDSASASSPFEDDGSGTRKKLKGTAGKKKQFIQATFAMASNPELEESVRWTADGKGLEVRNIAAFCEKALPMYFKHQNFSSFVRQLNMYGFEKERYPVNADGHVFVHEHFVKNRPDLLPLITRKPILKGEKRVRDEADRLEELEKHNSRLEAENKRLKDAIAEHFNFFSSPPSHVKGAEGSKEKQLLMNLLQSDD